LPDPKSTPSKRKGLCGHQERIFFFKKLGTIGAKLDLYGSDINSLPKALTLETPNTPSWAKWDGGKGEPNSLLDE